MTIGLYDVDSHRYPNLPLMKISAWHKARGDDVEFVLPLQHYDRIYVSKIFGDEYSRMSDICLQADEIIYGGTGFAVDVAEGREIFRADKHADLPSEIEHIYPDYGLYPDLTRDTAFGFLTRGCPNNCGFCIVTQKEGRRSRKVADLSEFWRGQTHIHLLDPNILACKERGELLRQLADSHARINFEQGLDARFITREVAEMLKPIRRDYVHFAFDQMENEAAIVRGLKTYRDICGISTRNSIVYMLTNFDTTVEEDLYRLRVIRELGYLPDVRIYRKPSAPQVLRDLQHWCNNRRIYRSCEFMDFVPRADGRTVRDIYFGGKMHE